MYANLLRLQPCSSPRQMYPAISKHTTSLSVSALETVRDGEQVIALFLVILRVINQMVSASDVIASGAAGSIHFGE